MMQHGETLDDSELGTSSVRVVVVVKKVSS